MKLVKLAAITTLLASGVVGMNVKAAEDGASYSTKGDILFKASTDVEPPVHPSNPDPENPVKPVDPTDPEGPGQGTQGPLSIDYISSFDFGEQNISTKTETYYAKPQTFSGAETSANYMQVTDKTGKSAGWRLSVEQKTDFLAASKNATNKSIVGAEITMNAADGVINSTSNAAKPTAKNIVLKGEGSSAPILAADAGAGSGLWTSTFGELAEVDGEVMNTGVSLMIPAAAQTDADKYQTELVWKIENVPGFE